MMRKIQILSALMLIKPGLAAIPSGCEYKGASLWCSADAVAYAWRDIAGGNCAEAMAIALGEGINPVCKLIGEIGFISECLHTTQAFNIDQTPYDGQRTLGPWQVMTKITSGATPQQRAIEAVAYIKTNCIGLADCPNVVDGKCGPYWGFPNGTATTIFATKIGPFCGCPAVGGLGPTMGWSGRCSNRNTDDYQDLMPWAVEICDGLAPTAPTAPSSSPTTPWRITHFLM